MMNNNYYHGGRARFIRVKTIKTSLVFLLLLLYFFFCRFTVVFNTIIRRYGTSAHMRYDITLTHTHTPIKTHTHTYITQIVLINTFRSPLFRVETRYDSVQRRNTDARADQSSEVPEGVRRFKTRSTPP